MADIANFQRKLSTVREVARRTRLGDSTIRRWVREKLVECVRLPCRNPKRGQLRILVDDYGMPLRTTGARQ